MISQDQIGFFKDGFKCENTRTTATIIEDVLKTNTKGIMIAIDFQKAFDYLNHSFIKQTRRWFGFLENFNRHISMILIDVKARIQQGGHTKKFFRLLRGARQGDPLASLLFIMCVEVLLKKIKMSTTIEFYEINGLCISRLMHIATELPNLPDKIESELYVFIWRGPSQISKEEAKLPKEQGGLGMPCLKSTWSIKVSWIRRITHNESTHWYKVLQANINTPKKCS